jgi:hypothetical protein
LVARRLTWMLARCPVAARWVVARRPDVNH